jgi:hypothetical protein
MRKVTELNSWFEYLNNVDSELFVTRHKNVNGKKDE